jgi:hypothetical protein
VTLDRLESTSQINVTERPIFAGIVCVGLKQFGGSEKKSNFFQNLSFVEIKDF